MGSGRKLPPCPSSFFEGRRRDRRPALFPLGTGELAPSEAFPLGIRRLALNPPPGPPPTSPPYPFKGKGGFSAKRKWGGGRGGRAHPFGLKDEGQRRSRGSLRPGYLVCRASVPVPLSPRIRFAAGGYYADPPLSL